MKFGARSKESDKERFESLLASHSGIVHKIAFSYAWSAEDRADLAQEIRFRLWKAFPSYDAQRSFSTWMYRVALNVALTFVHQYPQTPSAYEEGMSGVGSIGEDADSRILLESILRSLDALNRALLILHLEGLSYAEIGETLGLSESNVGAKLTRLRERLRTDFQ